MKLRNKFTGEIGSADTIIPGFNSIKQLNEEWEDYKEEIHWAISSHLQIYEVKNIPKDDLKLLAKSGNYFESEEEAELAVNKLKAWKRLKDAGFKFEGFKEDYLERSASQYHRIGNRYLQFNKSEDEEWLKQHKDDFDLLFGETE